MVPVASRTLVALSALLVLMMCAPSAHAAGGDFPFRAGSEGTIEFWGSATDLGSRNGVVYTADDGTSTHSHQIGVLPDGSVRLYLWDGSVRSADTASGLITANPWHHYALVWSDGGTADLYVDATKRASVAIGSSWKNGDEVLFGRAGGEHSGLANPWQGAILKGAVYHRALPATTIQHHYDSGLAGPVTYDSGPAGPVTARGTDRPSDSAISTALRIFLAVAGLGAGVAALSYLALRNSTATLALLLAVWVATWALRDAIDLSVVVSDVRVDALDVVSVALAGVGIARILSDGVQNVARGLALALFLVLAFHLARGIAEFGMQSSVNEARGWLYFTSALLYAATVPGGWDRRAWKLLAASGVLVAAIAVPYWFTEGLGSASVDVVRNGELVASRPITAAGALLILQAAILAPVLRWPSRQTAVYVAFGAGGAVLLLQHRTVWVAGALVAVVASFWWLARNIHQDRSAAFAAAGVVLLVLPIAVFGFARIGPLVESVEEVTSSDSSLAWRTTGWRELLSTHDSPSELATGQPAGAGFAWVNEGGVVDVSPHNGFIDAYIRFGLLGVLFLLCLGPLLWFRRSDIGPATGLSAAAIGLLVLTQFVFSIAYALDVIQGMIAGILVASLSTAPARVPDLLRSRKHRERVNLEHA